MSAVADPAPTSTQVVEAFEDALQQRWGGGGGLDRALGYLHPDVQVFEADSLPYPGVHRGHAGFRRLAEIFGRTWEFPPGKTFDYVDDGRGRVVVLTLGRAVGKRTGIEVEWRLAELFVVRDGLIVEIRPYYWDTAAIARAAGGD